MIGKKIKNYQIEELLGEGGMGVVYRARDLNLERMVAIKMLHPEMMHQPDLLKRFKNEAHVTARLSHPNIAILYNFFSEEDQHCLIMEYVNGKTVEDILSVHKQIPEIECIRILQQLLEGLNEAHKNDVLHRDIKPGNVMINRSGYVKLMDFGVARLESSARITRMNRVIGTLEYMAPELLTGGKPSAQTDLYSVGVTLYEMVYGKLPFTAESDSEITEMIMKGKISFPSDSMDTVFGRRNSISGIISKLMNKNQNRRYTSAREALADLDKFHVSGRVSEQLLSDEKLIEENVTKQKAPILNISEKIKALGSISTDTSDLWSKTKAWFISVSQTMEGKIIGAAICFALLMIILSGIFSTETPEELSDPALIENELVQGGVSFSPGNQTEPATNSTEGEANESGGQGDYDYLAPPDPIVVPQQREGRRSDRSGRGETNESTADDAEESQSENRDNTPEGNVVVRNQTPSSNSNEDSQPARKSSARRIEVEVSGQFVEGIFNETVSTATHTTGQQFYLIAAGPVYSNGYKIIDSGARIKAVVSDVKTRGNSRRAFLAVKFESVQAVDGNWLPISYPEYSNQDTGNVVFEKGRTIRRLRVESGKVFITAN